MAAPLSNTHWERQEETERGDSGHQTHKRCRNTKKKMKDEEHLVLNPTNTLSLSSDNNKGSFKRQLERLALGSLQDLYLHILLRAYSLEGFKRLLIDVITNTLRRESSDFTFFQMEHGYVTHQVLTAVLIRLASLSPSVLSCKYSKRKRLQKRD